MRCVAWQVFACSGLKKKYRVVLTEQRPAHSIVEEDKACPAHTSRATPAGPAATAFAPSNQSPLYAY